MKDNVSELRLCIIVDDIRCGKLLVKVEPHVERVGTAEAETPRLAVQLERRYAKIEKNAMHRHKLVAERSGANIPEVHV